MTIAEQIAQIAADARAASYTMARLSSAAKNDLLMNMAMALLNNTPHLIEENRRDLEAGEKKGLSAAMLDRLMLDEARIKGMADGLREVAALPDPVGEVTRMWKRPNNLMVGKMRIPLGVIGIVYESRPNVTADAAALCLKAGNSVILRGGSEAINSNLAIARILGEEMAKAGIPAGALSVIPFTDREGVLEMLKQEEFIDLIIPRGGESLIRFVVEHSKIPVIKHYKGVCHIFVDASADFEMAEQDHRQRQDPASRRLQRPGNPPHPQGRGGDLRPPDLRAPDRAQGGAARRRNLPPVRSRSESSDRGGLVCGIPRPDPCLPGGGRPGRGHRPYQPVRLAPHRGDRHLRLRQRPALHPRGEFRGGAGQRLDPLLPTATSWASGPRSASPPPSSTPSAPWGWKT